MSSTSSPKPTLHYFRGSFLVTALGLALGAWIGWAFTHTLSGTLSILFICTILAILEISLSFDNAIVNANKLKHMTPAWQRRFLTWGILIAVFGMRIVFPLAVVVVAAGIGPIEAMRLAVAEPDQYAAMMRGAQLSISAFGGTFLMMVALGFFFDPEKDVHWFGPLERRFIGMASVRGIEVAIVLALLLGFSRFLPDEKATTFIVSALYGLMTFLLVEILGRVLDRRTVVDGVVKGGFGAFLYLEVLDASFSFDGVIGAFALSQNLFVIAIGLGIGAMYVRSMTIMLVEKGTLVEYRYLEHGAFYAILLLSVIMYAHTIVHVPEVITGLGGVFLIGLAFQASRRAR
ncbi:DUF475 domain-containing protein [Oceaniglobus trochenteri]|uniref:DUF475 domain-containing protein n=1 Tax=Oceaniglobus trochenteri TaxID=2763260 RepID=UPI001CFF8C14|nr:DUF475 domain-containing protein [Oceaniglobus trochenteri]